MKKDKNVELLITICTYLIKIDIYNGQFLPQFEIFTQTLGYL